MEHIKIMKLLLNDKEIIAFLVDVYCHNRRSYKFPNCNLDQSREFAAHLKDWIANEKLEKGKKFNEEKVSRHINKKLFKTVREELHFILDEVESIIHKRRIGYKDFLRKNFELVYEKIGEDRIFSEYKKFKTQNFVKSVGFDIDRNAKFIRRKDFTDVTEDCLLRNTVGNEKLILNKIDNDYPFWFIDSGYTNFIEKNKKWHRLVRNHLHIGNFFDAPCDRLSNFTKFPQPWRTGGEKILVIEPGEFAAAIFKINITNWKLQIEEEIRKYSDRPIIFREKFPKKVRTNLYQHLCDEDYYCVININSNAATEAVWAGVPIITLGKHISNPISVNSIDKINNLVRPNIASWLAMLSYSQFTFDELLNGKALECLLEYHV